MPHDKAYYKAEKKIEETLKSGATELDLSNMQLTELPELLGQLSNLQRLRLEDNQLSNLPEWLGNLVQLKSLNLSINYLVKLPTSIGNLTQLQMLELYHNKLISLPDSLSQLTHLYRLLLYNNNLSNLPDSFCGLQSLVNLNLSKNQLAALPRAFGNLVRLESLNLSDNRLTTIPETFGNLVRLESLNLSDNRLTTIPESFGNITQLRNLNLQNNRVKDIPGTLIALRYFDEVVYRNDSLKSNPLPRELTTAYKQGLDSVKRYLKAKLKSGQITLNEAKLIIIGEGEVGKSSLLNALRGEKWVEGLPTTHGIKIKVIKVLDPKTRIELTLNGWDFGGQRVYRPTHQLFFSAPAVYLIVWKPREGPQQGFVKEWIQLVKRRAPDAKILVVATHGGPQQRQPDIDRQELWDLFGKETVVDFFFVDSKPDKKRKRKGIAELKRAITQVAASLPEVGRFVPKSFADVRLALQNKGAPYLPLREVLDICRAHNMDDEIARLFITISHRLGHLTHYENDPTLRDIVILRPDWLATAMSYVLDDEATRAAHGLVKFSRLSQLWDDKNRAADSRYPATLHPIFLRLMERFDLSYRVADPTIDGRGAAALRPYDPQSLIAQLVPDIRPQNISDVWKTSPASGDVQQTQICHIVDASNGQSASAEGLFYQLIVRLHKYSLGRADYNASVHWQRGLVLEDEYKSRAFLEHVGNDVRITVRSPYPEGLLGMLTREVKFLVESFWEGLRCDVMVPCIEPCGKHTPGTGLFEVEKLIDSKRKNRNEFPCPVCTEWQNIDALLRNAPAAAEPISLDYLDKKFAEVVNKMNYQGEKIMNRFDRVDDHDRRILSMADKIYTDLLQILKDEAKEGPRLFSLVPVNRSGFNPKQWTSEKFKLILWCEHARKPLPFINGKDSQDGVYEIERTREWFVKAAPFLKIMTQALSLALPIATAGIKLEIDKAAYDIFADQITFSKEIIDGTLSASDKADLWKDTGDSTSLPQGFGIRAENATLRELHAFLKERDPGFGGLVRVMNKRQEFLWVHEKFAGEY